MSSPSIRVLQVMERVRSLKAGSTLEGWAEVLAVPSHLPRIERDYVVAERLGFVRRQIDAVKAQCRSEEADEDTYLPALGRVESAISFDQFNQAWTETQNKLTPETFSVVKLLTQFLPKDPCAIDAEELAQIREDVVSLLSKLKDANDARRVPDTVRDFVLRQLSIILMALDTYPFRGAEAFEAASLDAQVHWASEYRAVESEEAEEALSEVKSLWGRIVDFGKRAALVHVFVAGLIQTADSALGIMEKQHLLLGPSSSEPGVQVEVPVSEPGEVPPVPAVEEETANGDVEGSDPGEERP